MRRGELAGLRWSDVDLERGALSVRQARVQVGYEAITGSPKSFAGTRRIALDQPTIAALKRRRTEQLQERLVMGAGWQRSDHDLLLTEPDGVPMHPATLSKRFRAASKAAGLPAIRLHDARHSALVRDGGTRGRHAGESLVAAPRTRRHRDHAEGVQPRPAGRRRGRCGAHGGVHRRRPDNS